MDGNNVKEDGHQRKCLVIILSKKIEYFDFMNKILFRMIKFFRNTFRNWVEFFVVISVKVQKIFLHNVQLCFPIMLMGVQLVSSYKIYDMISCFLRSMYLITRTTSFLLSELFFSPPGYDHLLLHVLLLNDNGQDNFVHVRTILKLPCFIFIILIYGQLIKEFISCVVGS